MPPAAATKRTRIASSRAIKSISSSELIAVPANAVASITHLTTKLAEYLTPSELKKVKEAYRFSDEKHLGQMRKSGEPYISHPIAVAEICADWK
ncbi:MAG: guanosine-3',5'-bis(diphosphate) 3'-pyrophosphohydrolase, partial [Glaciimonas sp.]|nr:guanosine-3',5'-bis(diphosphate) 3'-pyrophosphohydrolase [Glaciimonas sp.]